MSDIFKELKSIYPKFIVSADGQNGELPLDDNKQWTLKAVKSDNPDNWKVHDAVTGEFFNMPSRGIPAALRMTAGEFICTYKDLMPKDPIDNLKVGGFEISSEPVKESYPIESFEEPDKLAQLDAIMDGEATTPEPQKWKNGGAKTLTKKHPVQKMPAIIPDATRNKQIAELTTDDIINYICPKASTQEAMIFLKLCQARSINPFLKEAYLIKYDATDPAQMVVSRDYFARKAEEHTMYDGYESGIILLKENGTLERREGTFLLPDEKLVGGWCKVYRKDRTRPTLSEVALHEYQQRKRDGTLNKFWSDKTGKPATMIDKVAFSQCHRKAFPGEFSGMYDRAELAAGIENLEGLDDGIIEAEYREV